MKSLMKYSILLFIAFIYLFRQIDAPTCAVIANEQEKVVSNEKEAFHQLALLTALNGNAVPVNTVCEVIGFAPVFRYLPKNNFSYLMEESKSIFPSYFKNVRHFYIDSYALKQDAGYYVFALREIIV